MGREQCLRRSLKLRAAASLVTSPLNHRGEEWDRLDIPSAYPYISALLQHAISARAIDLHDGLIPIAREDVMDVQLDRVRKMPPMLIIQL